MTKSTMAGCTTIGCPRIAADYTAPVRLPKSKLLQDTSGNYWCTACRRRYELMNWAQEHHWPESRVQSLTHQGHYAIAGNEADWFASVAMGNADMIDALYTRLLSQAQPPSAA